MCLIAACTLNLESSPWDATRWWGMLKENAAKYARVAPRIDPLLAGAAPLIEEEVQLALDEDLPDLMDVEGIVGLKVSMQNIVSKQFGKVGVCRWFKFVVLARRLVSEWSRRWALISYILIILGTVRR